MESYITHIRIIEDAAYPSTPPPPNANPSAKKPRLVIIAVRKSGRVRMHKARENGNGTFSIGKTWMLDDLSCVQSYSTTTTGSAEEEQYKKWAGGVGFTVTIGKPYYWQAATQKEKQFFIASIVKIYTKYTGGKSPELLGFEAKERDQLLAVANRTAPASQPSPQQQPPPASYGRDRRRDPSREPPALRTQPSRDGLPRPPPLIPSTGSGYSQTSRVQLRPPREESPNGSTNSSINTPQQSQPSLRRLVGNNQSEESFGRSEDGASLPPRSRGGMNGLPNGPGRFQDRSTDRSATPNSQRTVTPDPGISSGKDSMTEVPPVPAPLAFPPERRRPPMANLGDSRSRSQNGNDNIVPAPLASPGMRREDLRPPTRSIERNVPRQPEQETPNGIINAATNGPQTALPSRPSEFPDRSDNKEVTPVAPTASIAPVISSPPPTEPPTGQIPAIPVSAEPEEDLRPGLGPMIKKKSKGDVAGQLFKAAKAANAFSSFKPRAGGAAERLREAQLKTAEGPDGVTGVVPAPSLLRGMSSDSTSSVPTPAPTPLERPASRRKHDSVPEVKIIVPESRPNSIQGPAPPTQETAPPEKAKTREAKRARAPAEVMAKELAVIGIDPTMIGDRGADLVTAWDEFGWVGDGIRTKNIDQMRDEVDRELNKVQAGGWLSRLEEEDDRIEAIKTGLDKCIEECEELDGLFTLYLVELGVSHFAQPTVFC